jgi:hypothetical protein
MSNIWTTDCTECHGSGGVIEKRHGILAEYKCPTCHKGKMMLVVEHIHKFTCSGQTQVAHCECGASCYTQDMKNIQPTHRPLTVDEVEERLRHSSMYELREPKIDSMINLLKKGKKFTYKGQTVKLMPAEGV